MFKDNFCLKKILTQRTMALSRSSLINDIFLLRNLKIFGYFLKFILHILGRIFYFVCIKNSVYELKKKIFGCLNIMKFFLEKKIVKKIFYSVQNNLNIV